MLRFFDAWGTQMDHMIIGNIWNKLGQQLRDDRGREAWVAANGEVLARLRRRSVEALPQCDGRQLANIVHGAAHVGLEAGELFEAVATAAAGRQSGSEPQDLANTVWAFATVKKSGEKLFTVSARAAERWAGEFNAQNLANTLWAFATMKHSHEKLFTVLARMA